MSHEQVPRHDDRRNLASTLLKSSRDLDWPTLLAELCSYHGPRKGPGQVAPHAKISITVRGSDCGVVTCEVAGSRRSALTTTGSIWLKPRGGKYDEVTIHSPQVEVLHLYVPSQAFAQLTSDYNLPPEIGRSVGYSCGVKDEVINQIGVSVLSEMMSPTAAGRMLVETSSLLLAARLAYAHCETGPIRSPTIVRHRLDEARLRRVLGYVEEHLTDDITVADLANVACLSIFHFTRAFAAAAGVSPHRYVSQQRLESAKAMVAAGRASLGKIAFDCQFASQSSFTRAFRRATGMTPGEYRRASR